MEGSVGLRASDTTFCCTEVFDPLALSSKTNPIPLKNG